MYQEEMSKGKLSMARQKELRTEFIARYQTENLRKSAEIVHDQCKEIIAKEIYRLNSPQIRTFFTLGILVIAALLIFLLVTERI